MWILAAVAGACYERGDSFLDITFTPCEALVLVPDSDADEAERASVSSAIAMWNEVSATGLTLQPSPGAAEIPIRFELASPIVHGYYDDELGTILINRQLVDQRDRAVTVAHELGHAFGLLHDQAESHPSVMRAGNLERAPTPEDGAALRWIWGACD